MPEDKGSSQVTRDIVVVGGSAGGVDAVRKLLGALPADCPAALFVVLHQAPSSPAQLLAGLLDRYAAMPVVPARDGMPIVPGRVVVAAPDQHLLLAVDGVRLSHGPRENHYRPSIDVLFRSAAVAFGPRVTGVVLSGMLDDGAAGLWAIKRRGGRAIVQDPEDAEYADMPRNAMSAVAVDAVVPIADLAERLVDFAGENVPAASDPAPADMAQEVAIAGEAPGDMAFNDAFGRRVPVTCPECGGALWEMSSGPPRFRCHVGHAYSLHTLGADQSMRVEAALWAALRSLEEAERLSSQLSRYAGEQGRPRSARSHAEEAVAHAAHADALRTLLNDAPARRQARHEEATDAD